MRIKHILIGLVTATLSWCAQATTLSPIQLLSPSGSTSGQAIVSAGPSSAPAWGNISAAALTGVVPVANGGTNSSSAGGTSLDNITGFASTGFLTRTGAGTYAFQSLTNGITYANLAQAAANTVLGNATGSTANVTAITVTGCNGAAQALQWTNGTGFGCNSTIATSGANANITSLSGLTTPLSIAQGGTGSATQSGALSNILGASTVPVANGGTGRATLTAHGVLVGEGTSAINQLAVGTTGQVLVGATGADPAFGSTVGALTFTGIITPSTTAGIAGTTAADNANAGSVGYFQSNSTTGTAITSGTTVNATSISLAAGDYDCWSHVDFIPSASSVVADIAAGVTTTSATLPAAPDTTYLGVTLATGGNGTTSLNPMIKRINVSTTTTVYVVAEATSVTVSTASVNGYIQCRVRR